MQLVEALILLFAGLAPGVWVTLVDVYAVGASAFSTRIALWMLLIVLVSTNLRHRRQAAWGSAWLSLGCVESYYLSSSYTFEGMSRSTVVPLALLSVVAAGVAWVSWTAKHERGTFGLALKALVLMVTLVACVATHDALNAFDIVCVALIAYCLFFMRSRRVALERHRPDTPVVLAGASDEVAARQRARGTSREALSSGEQSFARPGKLPVRQAAGGPRPSSRPSQERRRGTSPDRRRRRRATGRRWSAADEARAVPSAERDAHAGKAVASAPSKRSGQREPRGVTSLQLQRGVRLTRSSGTDGTRAGSSSASEAKVSGNRRVGGPHASQRSSGRKGSQQRVAARTGSEVRNKRGADKRSRSEDKRSASVDRRSGKPARAAGAKAAPKTSQAARAQARTQRPTKRTGGAVPEANRMRGSSSDGHGHAGAKPHRRTGSSGSSSRR